MPMPSSEVMFWKISLHKYVPMHADTYMWENSLPKTQSLIWALPLQAHFQEWRLLRFGKELFKYQFYKSSHSNFMM